MISNKNIISWLETKNRQYSAEGISHDKRPFCALSDFTREHDCSLLSSHPTYKTILQWFYENTSPGAHKVGSVYTGIYFYDTAFWPVHVPVIFGVVNIGAFDCLQTMPQQVKEILSENPQDMKEYFSHWINCMDYGYGMMDLTYNKILNPRAVKFLSAAHAEIKGAHAQLLDGRPNHKAILNLRMASEIFLKTVLIQEIDISDSKMRDIGHKLEFAAQTCAQITSDDAFEEIANRVQIFPPVSVRYDQSDWPVQTVWEAALVAQLTAAVTTRRYSGRSMMVSKKV